VSFAHCRSDPLGKVVRAEPESGGCVCESRNLVGEFVLE
jgi:hypothetical protein